jgi:hypothetical protein
VGIDKGSIRLQSKTFNTLKGEAQLEADSSVKYIGDTPSTETTKA